MNENTKSSDTGTGALRRAVMAAVAVAVAVASLVGLASTASAALQCQRNYQFVPTEVWPEDIEDWWPDNTDEIELRYLGQAWSTPIRQWERKYPPASGVFTRFPGQTFGVDLLEWDGSARQLGTRSVGATPHVGELGFYLSGDYSYRLTYEVKDLGVAGCVALSGFSVSPTSVIGKANMTGTITLSGPAPASPIVVSLASSSPAASVPATVTVPAGQTSTRFTIRTTPVTNDTPATITASYDGVSKSVPVTVKAPALSTVSVSPTSVIGGSGATLTVKLNGAAPAGGVPGTISINTPAASAPVNFTISAGSTTATVQVGTVPVSADTTATISVTVKGVTRTVPLLIKAPTPVNLAVDPASVLGGGVANGSIGINGPAPAGGLVISLASSSPVVSLPASVTITAGQTSVSFSASTAPVSADTGVTISATANGVTKTVGLTVRVPRPASVSLNPSTVTGGEGSTGTVTLAGPAPAGGLAVQLSSNNPAVAPVSSPVTVPGGAWSAPFWISTTDPGHDDIADISATVADVTKTATLTVLTNWQDPPECIPNPRYECP